MELIKFTKVYNIGVLDKNVENLLNKRFYKCTSSTVINNVAKAAARLYRNKAYIDVFLKIEKVARSLFYQG